MEIRLNPILSRCTSQHWRDIVLTPDELFLDLLSYHGELIKITSFSAYKDKLKAAAAYVNRVLPVELNLKLSQKCTVLVDQINAETKIKSHHVSTYASIERFGLQHNKRKAGGVIVSPSDQPKRMRVDSGTVGFTDNIMEEDDEGRYFYDENENQLAIDGGLTPSLQAIKSLEDLTLKEPHNIAAWSELHSRLVTSGLPKRNELGLACLSEGLNHNPKSAQLWTQYLRLFYRTQSVENNDEFDKVISFCDDHVELDTAFWMLRVNLTRNIVDKGQILEKYISRLLEVEEKTFELELVNAILYRAHLLQLESGVDEASETIVGFTQVYDFSNTSRLALWLTWLTIRVTGSLPDEFTTVKIDLTRAHTIKSSITHFDPLVYPFFEQSEETQFELDQTDLDSVMTAVNEVTDNWSHSDAREMLLLQIVEIIHKSSKTDYASSIAHKLKRASFYSLAIYLQSESLQIDDDNLYSPSVSFILGYQATEQAKDEPDSALGFLEGTISHFYKGDCTPQILIHLYRRLLQVTLSDKEPLLNVDNEVDLPELDSVKKVLDSNNLWLWCCYLLAEYINHPEDMSQYFEMVLRAIG